MENSIEKIYDQYMAAGYTQDQATTEMILNGHNAREINTYAEYFKKKKSEAPKEYAPISPKVTRNYYVQIDAEGSRSVSESGFLKPTSESPYNQIIKADYKAVVDFGNPGRMTYMPAGQTVLPPFGEGVYGDMWNVVNSTVDGEDLTLDELMQLDTRDADNYKRVADVVIEDERERAVLDGLFSYANGESNYLPSDIFRSELTKDRAERETPRQPGASPLLGSAIKKTSDPLPTPEERDKALMEAQRRLSTYRKEYFNEKLKSAVGGKFVEGEDPAKMEDFLLSYGYATDIDENNLSGTPYGNNWFGAPDNDEVAQSWSKFADGFANAASYFEQALHYIGYNAAYSQIEGGAARARSLYEEKAKQIAERVEARSAKYAPAYMTDDELYRAHRESFDTYIGDVYKIFGSDVDLSFTPGEFGQTVESAPATMVSLAGAGATALLTRSPQASAGVMSLMMGLQVQSQEYNSTLRDPAFQNYFLGEEPVSMEEAMEIDRDGNLSLKPGYTSVHDVARSAGHSVVSAGAEVATEYISNLILFKGAGRLYSQVGRLPTPSALAGAGIARATGSRAAGRLTQYTMGTLQAVTGGAAVEGYEEVVAEVLQHASRSQFSQPGSASLTGFAQEVYNGFIDPDYELSRRKNQAFKAGALMGAVFGSGASSVQAIRNENQIRQAEQALKDNSIRLRVINEQNGTDFDAVQYLDESLFGTYEEFQRYEEARQKIAERLYKPIMMHQNLLEMGLSKNERKLLRKDMQELQDLLSGKNNGGEVDINGVSALMGSVAARIDGLRGKIEISKLVADDLMNLAKKGNVQAAQMIIEIMNNQLEMKSMSMALTDPNITDRMADALRKRMKKLDEQNSDVVARAYKQAEGKGFNYTFVKDPKSASEAVKVEEYERDPFDENVYNLRYTTAQDLADRVSNTGAATSAFSYTESVMDGARVAFDEDVDELDLRASQKTRLKELIKNSPGAIVYVHNTQESIDAAGAKAGMKDVPAFTLQNSEGRVFEIHLQKGFTDEIVDEEALHYEFNEELYKDEVRRPMIEAINKAIQKNPEGNLAAFVRSHNSLMAGNTQKIIEIELLTNLARVIATQEDIVGGGVVKASEVESIFKASKSGFLSLSKRADKYLKGKGPIKETPYNPSEVDNQGSVEGTAASYKPTFLDGKTIKGHVLNSEFNPNNVTEVSAKIKDYNHYRNWYAKMTGNNTRPLRGLHYVDDNGDIVLMREVPGHEKTNGAPLDWTGRNLFYKRDFNTKEIIPMNPVPLSKGERSMDQKRRLNEQIEARRQSKLLRRQNLNALAMSELGTNIYNLAKEVPGVRPETQGRYGEDLNDSDIEAIELYVAEKLGVMPLSPKRVTLPIPKVRRDASGDIVEGTAAAAKLPTLIYKQSEADALMKEFGVDNLSDIRFAELNGKKVSPALAMSVLGTNGATIWFDKYSPMREKVSFLRIKKDGNASNLQRKMTSGSEFLMNREAVNGLKSIGANTAQSPIGTLRSAIETAEKNDEALIIGYLNLTDENVFSDPGGFNLLIDDVILWHLDEYKDSPLIDRNLETTIVNELANGINNFLKMKGHANFFLEDSVKAAMKKAKVKDYPFVEFPGYKSVKGFSGKRSEIPTLNPPFLKPNREGEYRYEQVRDAIKLLKAMSDQYTDVSVAPIEFGMRKKLADQLLRSVQNLENPNYDPNKKGKTNRKYLFSDAKSNPKAHDYIVSLMKHPDAIQGETHIYSIVAPNTVSPVNVPNFDETYRYSVVAAADGVVFLKSDPEFGLNEKSIHGKESLPFQKQKAGQVEFNVEGTANSRRLGRISYVNGQSWMPSDPTRFGKALDAVALKLQDKYAEIMMLQKDIEEFRGRKMAPGNDFNLAVDLMYGKTRNDLEALDNRLDAIKQQMALDDIKSDDLSDFVYAMHARERNAFIKSRRPDMESGSGMTNEEAEEIIDRLGTNEMRKLHGMVLDIVKNTRETMVKYGLESSSTIGQYEDIYDFYIPLSGQAVDETSDEKNMYPTGGIGMAIYGPTSRKAKGRSSKTGVNVVAQAVMQNARVQQLARKNEALQSLHSMFAGNPNEDVVQLWSPQNRMKTIDEYGKERNMSDSEMRARKDMVPVRINGEQHFIQFKNESHANTINGLSVDPTNIVTRAMRKPAQWLRNVFTVYDPNFFVTNFSRDIQSALYNALAEAERSDGVVSGVSVAKLTKEVLSNTATSLRGLLNENAFGREMSPELAAFYEEWKESGGQTGWGYTKDIDSIIKDLDKDAKSGLPSKVWKGAENVAKYVEGINEAFENSIRLSAYISARKLGVTKERAAQLSKNVTVNFNRSGEWGSTLSSVYLFFNAAMQGNARILRSLFFMKDTKKPNGELESWYKRVTTPQKIAFGMTTLSALATMINLAMSDEDDDGELFYNKIPDYEKERNLIIMVNGKGYLKVPLPYGYNIFNNFGVAAVEAMSGHRAADDALMFLATSGISAFSPISFGQSDNPGTYAMKALSPTVIKPLAEISANETYFGSKVYQEQLPFGAQRPESEMAFRSPEMIQDFFKWMNEATGGSKYKSGETDINFDPYWYMFEYFVGGSGRFIGQSGQAIYDVGQATVSVAGAAMQSNDPFEVLENMKNAPTPEIKLSEVPLLRKVYGEPTRYYDYDLFEENANNIIQLKKEIREGLFIREEGRYDGVNQLYDNLNTIKKNLKAIRDERDRYKDIKDYIKRSEKITESMEKERKLIMKFNYLYEQARGKN